MKRTYHKPAIEVESFVLTQQITTCSFLKIGFNDAQCVMNDPDSTAGMKTLANFGYFSDGCGFQAPEGSDYVCYHTQSNMAFTS